MVDFRLPAIRDIVTKCEADEDEHKQRECDSYKESHYRSCCLYLRFGFICDRMIEK
jgi:hypothetical protein